MTKETGGPAFPTQTKLGVSNKSTWITEIQSQSGMTLRDYFAAKALHSMQSLSIETEDGLPEQMAKWAYAVADAMLEARNK